MGRGRWGGGEEGARGGVISQMAMLKCLGGHMEWNEVTEFSDFVYPCNAGYPS